MELKHFVTFHSGCVKEPCYFEGLWLKVPTVKKEVTKAVSQYFEAGPSSI